MLMVIRGQRELMERSEVTMPQMDYVDKESLRSDSVREKRQGTLNGYF